MKKIFIVLFLVLVVVLFFLYKIFSHVLVSSSRRPHSITAGQPSSIPTMIQTDSFPLSLSAMRNKSYPGSVLTIQQNLANGSNYTQSVVSYISDGLKIYGLLTIPSGKIPAGGWPVILLNHGYIPPAQYSTTQSYSLAVSALASQGYIVFKPDYRGNGNSEGEPMQVYVSADYVTDTMNALASLKKYTGANPDKIGVWGHSMGGNITLHNLVINKDIKAAVIWGGVVGSYSDILDWWKRRIAANSVIGNDEDTAKLVEQFVSDHGTPASNMDFWNSIDPTKFLSDVHTPILLQVGSNDTVVPPQFSDSLEMSLKNLGKTVSLQTYPGADHNLSPDSVVAMQASVAYFDKYLK